MMAVVRGLNWFSAKPRLIALFLLCALPAGLVMAMLTPPGQVPDEPAHMARAAGLLRGAVLAVRETIAGPATGHASLQTGVKVDSGLLIASFGQVDEAGNQPTVSLADYDAMRNQPAAHALVFVNIPNTATYFPALYLPAALGLAIGLLLKASPFVCLMLGRAGMLSAFLLLGSLALIVAAYGEALLLTVLLLPMTLFLAGSLNEDGVLIALACLSAAAFTRDPMRQPKFRLLGIAVLVVMLGCKPPYLPLLGLALLPLGAPGFWRRAGQMVVASLPVLLWVGIIIAFVVVPFGRPPYHPGPLFTGDPERLLVATNSAANLHILLAQPTRFVSLPWQTLWYWHAPLYQAMIGILGLLNLHLTDQYYNAWSFALVAALLGLVFTRRPAPFNPLDGALVLVVFIVACWTLTISLYLSWTDVGAAMIDGLQGRYFLLFLPFIALAVPAWRSRFLLPAIVPALPALALGIYDLGYLPMKLVVFYYVH